MMMEKLAGMTILERQLFTLSRAGIRRVWVAAQAPKDPKMKKLRWPPGLETFWVSMIGDQPAECHPPYLGMSGDHVVRPDALASLLALEHKRHTSYQDSTGRGVVQIVPFRRDSMIQYDKKPMPPDSCALLQVPPDLGPALPWLLRSAVKAHDGFMARHFDRHISLFITRQLLKLGIRPNTMTLVSSLIGLAGASLFRATQRSTVIAGSLVVWLHTLLDGCDGELARLRFQESRLGGILDFWGDNLVHMALFLCIGMGLSKVHSNAVYLLPGAVAAVSVLFSALLVFGNSARRSEAKAGGPLFDGVAVSTPGKLASLENLLAQRDFIYLLILCAAIDRMEEFLWAAGVGTPLFLVALLYLGSKGGPRKTPTKPECEDLVSKGRE